MAHLQDSGRIQGDVPSFGAPKVLGRYVERSGLGPGQLAFDPSHAHAEANLEREPRHRNRTMWAQALVLFNVVGIPLSHGAYLEFYYTTSLPNKSISSLSIIIAIQILCILAMPFVVGCLYHWLGKRAWWRLVFILAGILAFAAQLTLQWSYSYMIIVIIQGLVLGAALGTLFTISTLVLASHYQYNLPIVSMQSSFAGFSGAVVHTVLARQSFRLQHNGHNGFAAGTSGGILGLTLLIAYILITRVKPHDKEPWTTRYKLSMQLPTGFRHDLLTEGTIWFVLGYILVFFALFIYPLYILLLLTQPPTLFPPDVAVYTLLATLGAAAFSASISANLSFGELLGPVNTFIAACIFAGAVVLAPTRLPYAYIVIPLGGLYGVALGAILALHIMVSAVFLSPRKMWQDDMPARVAIVMALAGTSAFSGIVACAAIIETRGDGVQIALILAGACLVSGGGLIALVRVWRWRGVFYAV